MVLYETTYNDDLVDNTFFETITIGIGGTCTIRLHNGKVMDLVETNINYNIRTISGRSYEDVKLGFENRHAETITYGLNEISEVIFEGFIITPANRDNILKLLHEDGIRFTKIPIRD